MTAAPDALAGIPALPVAVAKVLEETAREEPDSKILTNAIETDAGLASKLLSVVNSPYYGLNGTITSLGQAVMVVGLRQVRNVALAVGALRSIPGIPPPIVDAFLERAMKTAALARTIASKSGRATCDPDTAYLGGLLHGVGSLVAIRMGNVNPSLAEIAELGKLVLEHWKLPETIILAVAESAGPFGEVPVSSHAVHASYWLILGKLDDADASAIEALRIPKESLLQFASPVG